MSSLTTGYPESSRRKLRNHIHHSLFIRDSSDHLNALHELVSLNLHDSDELKNSLQHEIEELALRISELRVTKG